MRVLRVWLYLFVYIDGRVESPGLIWFCKSCASTLTQYFPDFVISLYKSLHNAVRFATERPCLPSAPRPKLSAAILARCTRAVREVRQAWASTSGGITTRECARAAGGQRWTCAVLYFCDLLFHKNTNLPEQNCQKSPFWDNNGQAVKPFAPPRPPFPETTRRPRHPPRSARQACAKSAAIARAHV